VPSVVFKTETAESHYKKYLSMWDAKNASDVITIEQFYDFYKSVSAGIDSDEEFAKLLKSEWHF
jgi:hypothetical protein